MTWRVMVVAIMLVPGAVASITVLPGDAPGSESTSVAPEAANGPSVTYQSSATHAGASCSGDGEHAVLIVDGGSANCRSGGNFADWAAGGALVLVVGIGGTMAWLAWLRWFPAMGGFTRLRKDKLLDHPLRAHLHQLIEGEPGIHFQALVERTGKANGQVSHHLATLVRADLVTTVRAKGYSTYFLKGMVSAPVMHGLTAVRSPTAVAVLRAVADTPGAPTTQLATRLGRPESTVRHHCHKLSRAGLVDGSRVLSAIGQQVLVHIPDSVGRPRRPPGPVA